MSTRVLEDTATAGDGEDAAWSTALPAAAVSGEGEGAAWSMACDGGMSREGSLEELTTEMRSLFVRCVRPRLWQCDYRDASQRSPQCRRSSCAVRDEGAACSCSQNI